MDSGAGTYYIIFPDPTSKASGQTIIIINADTTNVGYYDQTYNIQDPVERRFMGGDFWIWQYADYSKQYLVCADVARGDSSDYSAFHVIESFDNGAIPAYKLLIGSEFQISSSHKRLVFIGLQYLNIVLQGQNRLDHLRTCLGFLSSQRQGNILPASLVAVLFLILSQIQAIGLVDI